MVHLPTRRSERRPDRRPSSTRRLYDAQWRAARREFLQRPENALCRICEQNGVLTSAELVDHIEPHRGDLILFWNKTNWQPLCGPCHSTKTATEDGGFGNQKRAANPEKSEEKAA